MLPGQGGSDIAVIQENVPGSKWGILLHLYISQPQDVVWVP